MQFSSKDIQLFNEAGIHVEDKNYTNDEVERLKIKVTDFIEVKVQKILINIVKNLVVYYKE